MKRHIVLALALTATFVGGVQLADALPSLLAHSHHESLVRWGSTSGNSVHNHRSARSFRGLLDTGEPYSAYLCWDNRNDRLDTNGTFSNGHCFIDEWSGSTSPRYVFTGSWPAAAQARVRDAFAAWSAIGSDNPNMRTGIRFEETTNASLAEITVNWSNLTNAACGGSYTFGTRLLRFDSSPPGGGWNFDAGTGSVPNNQWHFYSVALHEVGHVV
ncbi:MAG: hypothetical protein AAGE94_09990, partial [Acidobacteriota bacterium]